MQVQIRLKRAMWIEEDPAQRIRGIEVRNNEACRSTLIQLPSGLTVDSSPTRWRVISKNLSIASTRRSELMPIKCFTTFVLLVGAATLVTLDALNPLLINGEKVVAQNSSSQDEMVSRNSNNN